MIDWKERYMREVEGLNNEGDPIGGDPPSGLRHQVEALKAENAAQEKRITEQLEAIEATAEFAKAFWEKADKHRDTRVMVSTFQQLEQKLRTYLSKNGDSK